MARQLKHPQKVRRDARGGMGAKTQHFLPDRPKCVIWVGLLSAFTFFLSLVQLRLDFRGKAEAHHRSMRLYADVKALIGYALSHPTEPTAEEFARLTDRYSLAGEMSAEISERDFLPAKQRHLIKVEMSRHLDGYPFASKTLLLLKGIWRDSFGGTPKSKEETKGGG